MERARVREALLRRRSDEEWELLLRRLRNEGYRGSAPPAGGARTGGRGDGDTDGAMSADPVGSA
jgi:restriction endonuclease Mrr